MSAKVGAERRVMRKEAAEAEAVVSMIFVMVVTKHATGQANVDPRRRTGPQLAGTVPRQGESRERYARGDNHPLDAVEHIGDRRDAPNRSTGLEAPQFLAAGR